MLAFFILVLRNSSKCILYCENCPLKIKEINFLESIEKVDCVILMVPSSKEVNEIIFKKNKIFKKLKKVEVL